MSRVEPSPLDVLSGHKDFDKVLQAHRRGTKRDVVSHRGWRDPTPKQLSYIAKLAAETGRKTPKVKTRQGASAAIEALLRHREQSRKERSRPVPEPERPASADRP